MQPLLGGNVSANRMQNLKTRFRKFCWGAAWLRRRQCQCEPNAERWELNLKSYAEAQPDFANAKIQHAQPEIHIFSAPDIAPRKFSTPPNGHSTLYLRTFRRIFRTLKKWNRDITFYLMPILKTCEAATSYLTQILLPTPFCYWSIKQPNEALLSYMDYGLYPFRSYSCR